MGMSYYLEWTGNVGEKCLRYLESVDLNNKAFAYMIISGESLTTSMDNTNSLYFKHLAGFLNANTTIHGFVFFGNIVLCVINVLIFYITNSMPDNKKEGE